jgi:predicted DNA-binding transcriptional regulator YafY
MAPRKKQDETRDRKHISNLLTAVLEHREVKMQYYSASSRQTKEYLIEPYRLAYAQGGMYLIARVPKYRQLRTFAVERIRSLTVTSQTFEVPEGASPDPFSNSLGVHTGPPERIEIDFLPEAAVHVKERSWHASQQFREKPDGSLRLSLHVCNDWALRSWILSFGPLARVVAPSSLAESILEQLEEARDGYAPQLDFEFSGSLFDLSDHPRLPFRT